MSSSKAKSSACSTLLLWSHLMYQRAVNGSATSVWRQIKRAEGGQISSTTLVYALVVSMTKKLSNCNLRGVVSHHLSYMSVKGRRIVCIIGLSGLLSSCGTYLSVMSIVRCPIVLVFVGNQYVQSNYESGLKNWYFEPSNRRILPLTVSLQSSTSIILTSCLVHLCPACEQVFSVAKFIRTDTWKSMSPSVFESIPLLKVNWTEWDALSAVGKSMGKQLAWALEEMMPCSMQLITTTECFTSFTNDEECLTVLPMYWYCW